MVTQWVVWLKGRLGIETTGHIPLVHLLALYCTFEACSGSPSKQLCRVMSSLCSQPIVSVSLRMCSLTSYLPVTFYLGYLEE